MAASNLRFASISWQQGLRFTAGPPGGPTITLDGDGEVAPSPVVALLMAAGTCAGSDVVLILEKMRVRLTDFRIEVTGTRRETEPKRFVALQFTFHLRGEGLDEAKARRAIDLSLEKYCSVVASLAPDIPIGYEVDVG